MSWLDDLLGKKIQQAGSLRPDRKILNFVSGATVADNPATGSTDVTVVGSGLTAFAGANPNAGGDVPTNGTRGDTLKNTGTWNGFAFWSAMITGSPAVWSPTGRGGNSHDTAASYQAVPTDLVVRVTSTAAVRTITLPDTTTIPKTFYIDVKDVSFSATENNTLIVGHAGELIDGSASVSIVADGQGNAKRFSWNGITWDVMSAAANGAGTAVGTAISYTMALSDTYIGVTNTAVARTVTLLPSANFPEGKTLAVKDESGGAATHNISIAPNGADTIDGVNAAIAIDQNYGGFALTKRGSGWWTV